MTKGEIKQHQQVIDVMNENGGYATLGFLYQNVDVSKWKSKTPFKSINRIVQDERFFFKIRPGLWALKTHELEVLKKFNIDQGKETESTKFSHSYYQGLVVEIGNIKGYQTFVPNQDKNKLFLNTPLGQISSLNNILPFSYDHFVKKAQNIDVIWFNNRKMPESFFEIEHSTDIYNSILKFSDLRDFYSNFCIVADEARKREYQNKLSSTSFEAIRSRILFLSYESLSQIHTNTHNYMRSKREFSFL